MSQIGFELGGMWESSSWAIAIDYQCSGDFGNPCKHCHSIRQDMHGHAVSWICPRVVIAENEAGHSSTGVCADCIMDALAELERP